MNIRAFVAELKVERAELVKLAEECDLESHGTTDELKDRIRKFIAKVRKKRNRRIATDLMSQIEEACSIHTKHCGCCRKIKAICTGCNKDVLLDLELGTASEGEGSESL